MAYTPPSGSTVAFNLTGTPDYTAPGGKSVAFDFTGYPRYLYPPGDKVGLNFISKSAGAYAAPIGSHVDQLLGTPGYVALPLGIANQLLTQWQAYTPPTGDHVGLEFGVSTDAPVMPTQYLYPSSSDMSALGLASLRNQVAFIGPSGIKQDAYGTPSVINWQSLIKPAGFVGSAYGVASLINKNRFITGIGFNALAIGTAKVENWRNYLKPAGLVATAYGTAALAGGVRYVDLAGRGIAATAFGMQRASYAVNLIIPVGYAATTYGKPMMGFTRPIAPVGYDAELFGDATVWDNTQHIYAQGYDAKAFGTPFLAPRVRTLVPLTIPDSSGFGVSVVVNKTRQIFPYTDTADTWGPYFSTFYYVENRNKTIATFGVRTQAFGLATIENGARALQVQGLDGELYGQAMVAYRIRRVYPDPLDASFLSNWAAVRNAARLIQPAGFNAALISHYLEVINTTRELARAGNFESLAFGLAYADYRIRTLTQVNGIQAPYVPIPSVIFRQRFILPVGLNAGGVGVPFAEEHFTVIAPRWVYTDRFGDGYVANRNVSTMPYGYDQALYGRAEVKNRNTYAPVEGLYLTAIGSHRVSDTKQIAYAVGLAAMRTGTGHRVQLLQPDLPYSQYVDLDGKGFGPPTNGQWIGVPNVHSNVLYPNGFVASAYGTAKVVSMGIAPQGIYLEYENQWGLPSLNATQWVTPQGIPSPVDSKYSAARIDPYTIWCDRDAPAQAVANHGDIRFYAIDGKLYQSFEVLTRPFFGTATISLKNRRVNHYHDNPENYGDHSRYGTPFVSLRIRTIAPEGLKAIKFGFPQLPSGVDIQVIGSEFSDFGFPSLSIQVDPRIPRRIYPQGTVMTAFGTQRVELFIRNVYPQGSVLSIVQKVLRVGPPVRAYPASFDSAQFGASWASYRIRQVIAAGFDASGIGYTIGGFNLRMRVYRRDQIPTTQHIGPSGFYSLDNGFHSVTNKARTIQPINCCGGARYGRPVVQTA